MNDPVALLILEDSNIFAMMDDVRILACVPCLESVKAMYARELPNCKRCNDKKKKLVAKTMNGAKSCLTSLSPAKRAELKRLLHARKVRLIKRNSVGGNVKVTF